MTKAILELFSIQSRIVEKNLEIGMNKPVAVKFLNFVKNVLNELSFEVDILDEGYGQGYTPDLQIKNDQLTAAVEVKFYRSRKVSHGVIQSAANALAAFSGTENRILIVSCLLSEQFKEVIRDQTGVVVWDRSNLANFLKTLKDSDFYLEGFGQFILEAQQGVETVDPYVDINEETETDPKKYFLAVSINVTAEVPKEGEQLITELTSIIAGVEGWKQFEECCEKILKYLFKNDLSVWKQQQRTDDDLSRFDLICRIGSEDDFWKTLVNSFNSRYILFEFKNYTELMPQGQIYTTERYLFPRSLRGSCIIIARNGCTPHASDAAKGAMRENGKLILLLDEKDLKNMLAMRDRGESPNDFMSDKLDDVLMSLSR